MQYSILTILLLLGAHFDIWLFTLILQPSILVLVLVTQHQPHPSGQSPPEISMHWSWMAPLQATLIFSSEPTRLPAGSFKGFQQGSIQRAMPLANEMQSAPLRSPRPAEATAAATGPSPVLSRLPSVANS